MTQAQALEILKTGKNVFVTGPAGSGKTMLAVERAKSLAKRLRAGRIRINGSPINPHAPHGGFKLSGIGREFGRYGIEEFLEYKSVG